MLCAKRTTATASTVDVSNISPSGIIPTSAETVESMALFSSVCAAKNSRANNSAPMGNMMQLTVLMMRFKLRMISEFTALCSLASAEILAA